MNRSKKIKKGDIVVVITGKDKGRSGKVLHVCTKTHRVLVEGVKIVTKHQKARSVSESGRVIRQESPVHISNVALLDPATQKPTKICMRVVDGMKVRCSKSSGATI
ncbi:50S ribosomal protein L24 [Rickettsiales endosymbiont of Paramecium tredecaurelia]|uniref:50S ribosomal protein L24 n=1 Tax=Candidatus Sarmatiella mevalonica TaxID=2770581 RepID=UPI00192409FF|nr:50S ribosomal protein L24 [Candidatus Sarmatiella mevalonica]MBL3284568.1 50S ribosomal protein L24 [Candidatus Sarmatiella mevalonica]